MLLSHALLALLPALSVLAEPIATGKQYAPACSKKHGSQSATEGVSSTTQAATATTSIPEVTSTDSVSVPSDTATTSTSTTSTTSSITPQTSCTAEQIQSCRGNGCFCDIATTGEAICEGAAFCLQQLPDHPLPPCKTDDDCTDLPFFGTGQGRRCVISTDGICDGQNHCVDQSGCLAFPIVNQKRALEKVFRDARTLKESRRALVAGRLV